MNPHQKNVIYDEFEHLGYISDGKIFIQTDYDKQSFDYVEALLSFVEMDLTEFYEYLFMDLDMLEENIFFSGFHAQIVGNKEKAYSEYLGYIKHIQAMFIKLTSFCFSQTFFPEELGELNAYKRLHINIETEFGSGIPQELTEIRMLDGDVKTSFKKSKKNKQTPLEQAFSIPAGFVNHVKNSDIEMPKQYVLKSAYDAITLAFYQMVEDNVKVKKCLKCDKYFLVKNKQNTDYCGRIFEGGTQSCQQLGAMANFKKKNENNQPYIIFNLYYKRYHERKKVGSIKPPVFDNWNREACTKRDECMDGKCDLEIFEQWCYDSFPNRPRKNKAENRGK